MCYQSKFQVTYYIAPETIVPTKIEDVEVDDLLEDKDYKMPEGVCMAATGQCFSNTTKGIIPQLIDKLYGERSSIKSEMLQRKKKKETKNDEKKATTATQQQSVVVE